MGSIREYDKRDGSTVYRAEVRLKGYKPLRATFASRAEAHAWMTRCEELLRSPASAAAPPPVRHDWSLAELRALFMLPFNELVYRAHQAHRAYHDPCALQQCHLVNIKEGGCSEDCAYCAQSSRHKTAVVPKPLLAVEEVLARAREAQQRGVTRICLGAAWRGVRSGPPFERVLAMVQGIKALGMEVCCTLGMLDADHIARLKEAGLHAYNHNLDTSPQHYGKIVSTHTFQDRLDTIGLVKDAGVALCCGGIFGMGESVDDRLELIRQLAALSPHPDSVPLNRLEAVAGTRAAQCPPLDIVDFARMVAITRLVLPKAMVRLSAGRRSLSAAEQALCFFCGANSIFVGDKLLTVPNGDGAKDMQMLKTLGMKPLPPFANKESKDQTVPFLMERLQSDQAKGLRRQLSYKNADLVDFASNDYLGLASCGTLAKAVEEEYHRLVFRDGIRPHIGATGSRLLTGNFPYLEALEGQIASFHGCEAAVLFSSGYAANTGLLSCLGTEEDGILLDSQVHASTWDGARLSRAKSFLFRHNDLDSLEQQLQRARREKHELFVCVESLYSMSGDRAPLDQLAALCRRYDAWLIVDEAHATGAYGAGGRGLVSAMADRSAVLAAVHTFGKALGAHGAAVVGGALLRDYLINRCRTFIYTTAFPLHTLVTVKKVYEQLPSFDERRRALSDLISYFSASVGDSPLPIHTSGTAIQSIPVVGASAACALSERLKSAGFDVRPIRSPTVRPGSECLRVCLHSFNTHADVDGLLSALGLENRELFSA